MEAGRLVLIASILLFLATGCQTTTDPATREEVKEVTISSSEVFEYPTGISGDEETATIKQQPQNHEISRIVRDSTTNWEAVYRYKAKSEFRGTDYAEINVATASDGKSPNNNITLIRLAITVR